MTPDAAVIAPDRRHRLALGAVLALALAVRAIWGLSQPVDERALEALPDQREYLLLARNLLSGRGLHFYDPRFRDVVQAFRTPGYPVWIAIFTGNLRLVRFAQALLDTSTVLAVYLLARALLRGNRRSEGARVDGGSRPGVQPGAQPNPPGSIGALAAAAMTAVNPLLISFTGLLLSETLFTALLAWGMLLLVVGGNGARLRADARETPRARRPILGLCLWLGGGGLLALSALVRPSALPLPTLLGILAVFLSRPENRKNQRSAKPYLAYADRGSGSAEATAPVPALEGGGIWPPRWWPLPVGATMLLLTVLVVAPWAYRNWRVLGQWVWTTTNEGVTAYDGFNPDATGASDQSFLSTMPQLRRMGEVDRSRYLADKAESFAREHPARSAELAWAKVQRTWSPVPVSREFGDWKHSAVLLAYAVPLDLLVLAGLFGPLSGGLRPAAKTFLLAPALYFTCVHALSVGSIRYRIPVEPPMVVIAAAALAEAWRSWISKR